MEKLSYQQMAVTIGNVHKALNSPPALSNLDQSIVADYKAAKELYNGKGSQGKRLAYCWNNYKLRNGL